MKSTKKTSPRAQVARDLRTAMGLISQALAARVVSTETFPTSSREYPDSLWDALQWLSRQVCYADTQTGELLVDQVKARQVAMLLTGGDSAESDAWVDALVIAMDQYDKMYGTAGYMPTPFPI
jgi:hypothetical protein